MSIRHTRRARRYHMCQYGDNRVSPTTCVKEGEGFAILFSPNLLKKLVLKKSFRAIGFSVLSFPYCEVMKFVRDTEAPHLNNGCLLDRAPEITWGRKRIRSLND